MEEEKNPYAFFVDPVWRKNANHSCKGMGFDIFFPNDGEGTQAAQAICETCPVKTLCLNYALAQPEEYGVWGGVSERRRKIMRRQLRFINRGVDRG